MIPALFLALVRAAGAPPLPTEQDIVVTGRRWDRVACAQSTSQAAMIACITPRWKQIAAQVAERRRLARESGAR